MTQFTKHDQAVLDAISLMRYGQPFAKTEGEVYGPPQKLQETKRTHDSGEEMTDAIYEFPDQSHEAIYYTKGPGASIRETEKYSADGKPMGQTKEYRVPGIPNRDGGTWY